MRSKVQEVQSPKSEVKSAYMCREKHRVERTLGSVHDGRCILRCVCKTCGHVWGETYNLTAISQ